MPSSWRYLHDFDVPLLIQHDFGPTYYSIWLTDMTYVWSETLDRRQIIKKAFSLDTSIDPSEDQSQMRLLLSSIQKALDQDARTELSTASEDEGEHIALSLTTPLPASLPPLQWDVGLTRCAPSMLTQKLVVPLLAQQAKAITEKLSLLQHLKDKDNVISKVVNQMQADGCDMSKTFPGAVSSKSSTKTNVRQLASRSVKGLAEFDEEAWQSHISQGAHEDATVQGLLSKVSPIDSVECVNFSSVENSWWKRQQRPGGARQTGLPTVKEPNSFNSDRSDTGRVIMGEFQRQATPPHVQKRDDGRASPKQPQQSQPPSVPADDSTTDDSDSDLLSQPKRAKTPPETSQNLPKQNISSPSPQLHEDATGDSETAPTSTSKPPAPVRADVSSTVTASPAKTKSKLGKIGGKKKAEPTASSQPSHDELALRSKADLSSPEDAAITNNPKAKDIIFPSPDGASRGKTAIPSKQPSPTPEISAEQADRNRERLKRELDAKSQAAKKKKRKF